MRGLRARFLTIFLLALLPVLLGAASVVFSTIRREREIAQTQVQRWARTVAGHQEQLVVTTELLLSALAHTDVVRKGSGVQCDTLLQALQRVHMQYANLGVADSRGDVICSALPARGVNIRDRAYFQRALTQRRLAGGDYQVGRITGTHAINYGYPVLDDAGAVQRVVYAAINLEWLSDWSLRAGVPEGSVLVLLDTTHHIAYRYPETDRWAGRRFGQADVLLPAAQEGHLRTHGVDGVDRFYAYVTIPGPGTQSQFRLLVGIPATHAFSLSYQLGRRAAIFVILLLAGAMAIAWFLSDRLITRRVAALSGATRRLARGDLTARTRIGRGRDELAQLARSFDSMAESLQQNDAALRRNEQNNRLLADASQALAASADHEHMLQAFRAVLVPDFADRCVLQLADEQGATELAPGEGKAIEAVLRTGEPIELPERMVMPLRASGDIIGALSLSRAPTRGRFLSDERELALELGRRAALALENARLYQELEERVHARTIALTALNRELEAFSYSVSHDLRSPLRSMDGFSQALLEDYEPVLDDTGRDYLQRIRAAAQRMGLLIDDLLMLARVARADLQRQEVDVSALAREVVAELAQADAGRAVRVHIADDMQAFADRGLLRLVLENLLGNAWKFTGRTAHARIEVGEEQQDGETVFYVRDNGAGFDMAYADKLFAPFQRLHAMSDFAGTGVGLATVQRIVLRHGGRIWAQAQPNEGATFYFTLG